MAETNTTTTTTPTAATGFAAGELVTVERDEVAYPSKGTWPRYRGRHGTVVVADNWGEVGITFSTGAIVVVGQSRTPVDAWFKPHELRHR